MTDDELNKIADRLAEKIQSSVTDGIYRDAGRTLLSSFKSIFWGLVVALAAWGSARYGGGQ